MASALSGDGDGGDGVQVWGCLMVRFRWFGEVAVVVVGRWMSRYAILARYSTVSTTGSSFLLTSSSPHSPPGKDLTIHSQVHIHIHTHALLQIQPQEDEVKHHFDMAAAVPQEQHQEEAQSSQYSGSSHTADSPARGIHTAAGTGIGSPGYDNCSDSYCTGRTP